jgi:CHASE3 domain sensor protein
MTSVSIPQSAKDHMLSIKTIYNGKHGATVFAITMHQPNEERRALRIVNKDQSRFLTQAFIDNFKAIQNETNQPLARDYEHDTNLD